jgi:BirA family biotin operon repressor/biotin-[acetyl-CoA-carboxylase] ligase
METLFIGKNLLFLTEVESTNTYAMDMLRNVNAIEGTVVHTDNQTKGKGQRGASWNSAVASNITASIILKPGFLKAEDSFFLSKISALSIYDVLTDVLNSSHYDIKIKWPNDILVDSKKIAGILIENNYNHQLLQNSVIGMGLNVNQSDFHDLADIATSLKLLSGVAYDRKEILDKLCIYFEKWYLLLKSGNRKQIHDLYLNRLKGINQVLSFKTPANEVFKAKITDVNREGKLCLEMQDASIRQFDIKELQFLS